MSTEIKIRVPIPDASATFTLLTGFTDHQEGVFTGLMKDCPKQGCGEHAAEVIWDDGTMNTVCLSRCTYNEDLNKYYVGNHP